MNKKWRRQLWQLSTWTDLFTQRFYALTGLQPFFYTINFVHLLTDRRVDIE